MNIVSSRPRRITKAWLVVGVALAALTWSSFRSAENTADAKAAATRPNIIFLLADDLEWMGDSMVALRTYQALRSIEVLGEWPELNRDDVRFYAEGRTGVHAKLAAALAPKVKGCEWRDGFTFTEFVRTRSYDARDIKPFILPGVLRYFDVDEL